MSALDFFTQDATYYAKNGVDKYGNATFNTGVAIKCKFIDKEVVKYSPEKVEVIADATMYVSYTQDMELEDRITHNGKDFQVKDLKIQKANVHGLQHKKVLLKALYEGISALPPADASLLKIYDWLINPSTVDVFNEIIGDLFDTHDSDYTIYIDSILGDDISGNGTASAPYKTLERGLFDIPMKPKWKPSISLAAGDYTITKDLLFYFYVNQIEIQGTTKTESSHTITNVVSSNKEDGHVLTVSGAGWTPDEHIRKTVKFTSGPAINRYGIIYDNTADTIYVTQNGSVLKTIATGNTFDILDRETNIEIAKAGSPGNTLGMKSCRFKFIDCNLTGDGLSAQSSWIYILRSSMILGNAIGANASFFTIETSYIKGTGSIAWFNFQNTTSKLFWGSVIDGDGDKGLFTRDQSTVKVAGEVVMARLDNNGIATLGSFWSLEDDRCWWRWHDCDAGFTHGFWNNQDPGATSSSASNICNLPPMYGNLNNNHVIKAKNGDIYNYHPDSNVITLIGTNNCSVDNGLTEGYKDLASGTVIYGTGNEAVKIISPDEATIDVKNHCYLVTSANTAPTNIADLQNAIFGQEVTIRGGSSVNPSIISDGGNFDLDGGIAITLNEDDAITLYYDGSKWREKSRKAA